MFPETHKWTWSWILSFLMVFGLLTPLCTRHADAYTYDVKIEENGKVLKENLDGSMSHTFNVTLKCLYKR